MAQNEFDQPPQHKKNGSSPKWSTTKVEIAFEIENEVRKTCERERKRKRVDLGLKAHGVTFDCEEKRGKKGGKKEEELK